MKDHYSMNSTFFAEINLIICFSIYESLRKKWTVQSHPIKLTQSLLNQLKRDVFCHAAYSPDLVPSDYYLIPGLKLDLDGRHFAMKEDLQSAVAKFFAKAYDYS